MKIINFTIWAMLLTGCTTRVVVNLYPTDSSVLHLPICYLDNCNGMSAEQCADNGFKAALKINSSTWDLLTIKPTTILAAGERAFYIQARSRTQISMLENHWSEVGCVPHSERNEYRFRECVRHMPNWIKLVNSKDGHMTHLLQEASYRETCLRQPN